MQSKNFVYFSTVEIRKVKKTYPYKKMFPSKAIAILSMLVLLNVCQLTVSGNAKQYIVSM